MNQSVMARHRFTDFGDATLRFKVVRGVPCKLPAATGILKYGLNDLRLTLYEMRLRMTFYDSESVRLQVKRRAKNVLCSKRVKPATKTLNRVRINSLKPIHFNHFLSQFLQHLNF